jgi:two-component system NarL family sensor kinase
VNVTLTATAGKATLEVEDDGRGFSPGDVEAQSNGHFGLRMMGDLVRDAGGSFELVSAPGEGTRVRAEVTLS